MRRYQPIWLSLKKHNRVTISAPIEKHPNVIRMVSKEKYMDTEYQKKYGWRKKYITYRISGTEITFSLEFRTSEIVKGDL